MADIIEFREYEKMLYAKQNNIILISGKYNDKIEKSLMKLCEWRCNSRMKKGVKYAKD